MLTFRELPPAEWSRLLAVPPYATVGIPADNGEWRILVAEEDGRIVGHTSLHTQVHWDPWWIAPSAGPGVVRGLISQGRDLLESLGIGQVHCTIDDAHRVTQDLAERLGFSPAPGKLYLLNITELKEY